MIILSFIVLITIFYAFYRRRYGVWLKSKSGRAYFGYKKRNIFGVTTARFGKNIFDIIFEPDRCTLNDDGTIKDCKRQWSYNDDIIEWKPYIKKD